MTGKRIAVYSGSFNPLHIGHLAIIRHLIEKAGFDMVYLIVSPKNPLKEGISSASGRDRYNAAVEAVKRHFPAETGEQAGHSPTATGCLTAGKTGVSPASAGKVKVDDIELTMPEPHYTIRTLDTLKEREPDNTFTLVMGADNLAGIAYIYLINMALNEGLSVSEFLLYFTAVTTFTSWVMGILQEMSALHKESLDISRLREFLDYPEPFKFENGEEIPAAENYELKLVNVSFRYPGAETDTIHGLNLTVRPGEKLAIVGLNGAGKTTLVKLLCGLIDPTEGAVLLNGKDIRDFNRKSYYDLFSAVFQEFSVLDVTVAEQIAQTTVNIDYDKIADCVEKAGLTSTIEKLPKGLETHIGREVHLDGVLFSGGQTQRLMLARALYKNGPILLLDEPTAALDPIAENDIYMKYSEMTSGKTSLFISHRLASTRFCDRIIFVADGGIKEEGTHESLLALGGEYANLFEVQSRYYQEGKEF